MAISLPWAVCYKRYKNYITTQLCEAVLYTISDQGHISKVNHILLPKQAQFL